MRKCQQVILMLYQERLIELREENGLKQKELANLIGVNRSVYGRYEREYQIIPINHLVTLCDYFHVSLDYIFNFTKEKTKNLKDINKISMGQRLKELRKEHKITQEKLASLLHTSQSTIADYEKGKNTIPTPFLYTICKKYHVSADYLLGRTNK